MPVIHLDALYYDDRWNPLPQEAFAALQETLVAAPGWVIDGNYASSLPIRLAAADTVVFLDLPSLTCLWGVAERRLHGAHDRITVDFIRYVWRYRRAMRPRVLHLLGEHARHADVITLLTRRAARRWLHVLASEVEGHGPPGAGVPGSAPAGGPPSPCWPSARSPGR